MAKVALVIVLLAFACAAFCQEPQQMLKGYQITTMSMCHMNSKGLVAEEGEKTVLRRCFVAINPKVEDSFFLLVNDDKDQPHKIIKVNLFDDGQKIVWIRGDPT